MDWRRIRREILREATRGSVIGFAAFYTLIAAAFALAMAGTLSQEIYLQSAYLIMPLLFAPFAARLVTRDRERGYSAIASVNPLTRLEETLARALFLALFVLVTLGLTGPITAFISPPGGTLFEERALVLYGWGFFVGITSALAGLVIGTIALDKGAQAVGWAAGWSFAQFFIGTNFRDIMSLGVGPGVGSILHLDPFLTPIESASPTLQYTSVFRIHPLLGAGAVLAFHTVAYALVLALQDRQGWIPRRSRRSWAPVIGFALLATFLIVGSAAASPAISLEGADYAIYYSTHAQTFPGGTVMMNVTDHQGRNVVTDPGVPDLQVDILHGQSAVLRFDFQGAPGSSLQIGALVVESPLARIPPGLALPPIVQIGESGHTIVNLEVVPIPYIMVRPSVWLSATYAVNSQSVTNGAHFGFGDSDAFDIDNVPHWVGVASAGLIPALALGPVAVALPRRLNRW